MSAVTWCATHQRDYACDTSLDGELLGCCSLCAAALALAAQEGEGGGELHEHFTCAEDEDDACDDGAVACSVCSCLIGDEVAYGDTWDGRWVCAGCAGVEVH